MVKAGGAGRRIRLPLPPMVAAAQGVVSQSVESILSDSYLTAPTDGEISDIFPNVGELVSLECSDYECIETRRYVGFRSMFGRFVRKFDYGSRSTGYNSGIGK